mmetsp:Transcript_174298/g.558724  ORF Transcript_174298/g.558724 Transcript_174298/m.558724 type:complete len:358 (-) Transcript_174298:1643-2716(-)
MARQPALTDSLQLQLLDLKWGRRQDLAHTDLDRAHGVVRASQCSDTILIHHAQGELHVAVAVVDRQHDFAAPLRVEVVPDRGRAAPLKADRGNDVRIRQVERPVFVDEVMPSHLCDPKRAEGAVGAAACLEDRVAQELDLAEGVGLGGHARGIFGVALGCANQVLRLLFEGEAYEEVDQPDEVDLLRPLCPQASAVSIAGAPGLVWRQVVHADEQRVVQDVEAHQKGRICLVHGQQLAPHVVGKLQPTASVVPVLILPNGLVLLLLPVVERALHIKSLVDLAGGVEGRDHDGKELGQPSRALNLHVKEPRVTHDDRLRICAQMVLISREHAVKQACLCIRDGLDKEELVVREAEELA